MSHEVEVKNGKANLFYTQSGGVPWHGLGTALPDNPTVEKAIEAAGLDWEVLREPLITKSRQEDVPAFANVRATDRAVLGVVGPQYRPLQNREAFKWFQPFLDAGTASLETAGSLKGGSRVWVLAKVQTPAVEVIPGDKVNAYILLSNSHDGSLAVRAGFVAQRCVCSNTLAAAHTDAESQLLRVRHTKSTEKALEVVRETMDLVTRSFEASIEQYKKLAKFGVSPEDTQKYVLAVFEPPTEKGQKRLLEAVEPLLESGKGADIPGVQDTLWGAYNGVTNFLTWQRGRSEDTRLDSLWFGQGKNLNARALELATAMVDGEWSPEDEHEKQDGSDE